MSIWLTSPPLLKSNSQLLQWASLREPSGLPPRRWLQNGAQNEGHAVPIEHSLSCILCFTVCLPVFSPLIGLEPCPSLLLQRHMAELLSVDKDMAASFLNSVLNQLNWAFSEFIGMIQEVREDVNEQRFTFTVCLHYFPKFSLTQNSTWSPVGLRKAPLNNISL